MCERTARLRRRTQGASRGSWCGEITIVKNVPDEHIVSLLEAFVLTRGLRVDVRGSIVSVSDDVSELKDWRCVELRTGVAINMEGKAILLDGQIKLDLQVDRCRGCTN